jgi:hypothetical protein
VSRDATPRQDRSIHANQKNLSPQNCHRLATIGVDFTLMAHTVAQKSEITK